MSANFVIMSQARRPYGFSVYSGLSEGVGTIPELYGILGLTAATTMRPIIIWGAEGVKHLCGVLSWLIVDVNTASRWCSAVPSVASCVKTLESLNWQDGGL